MKMKLKQFMQTPGAYLLLAILLVNIICGQHGGNNPNSRFSLLRMMSEKATFNIEPIVKQGYRFWTDDWSRTDLEHYYSNKAPGSAFMALPFFLPLDKISKLTWKKQDKQTWFYTPPSRSTRKLTSIFSQVLFFIMLFLTLARRNQLAPLFKNQASVIIFLVLFGFANTASNYMNTLFGHGLAAVMTFWFINSLLINNPIQLGIAFGFGLLNDYSFAFFLFPALLFLVFKNKKELSAYLKFALGGIPAGILWVWYHWICFGSPLTIANKFQNPKYVDVSTGENIWGIFSTKLNLNIYYELLFGPKRGLLITQPWILVTFALICVCLFSKKLLAEHKLFIGANFITFLLLLIMNTSFGGWHGGSTFGPRYLSIIFPWFAMTVALLYQQDHIHKVWKILLLLSGIWSIWFFTLVNSTYILSNSSNILAELWKVYTSSNIPKSITRTLATLGLLIGAIYLEKRKMGISSEVPYQQETLPQ